MSEASIDSLWLRILPQPIRSRLAGRRLLQTLIENTGWLVADKVIRLGVGLLVGVWVARYLGPAQFGALNYAQAVVLLISALGTMGLPDIIVRDFVRHPERAREIAATSIILRVAGALLSILIAAAIVAVGRPGDGLGLAMAVVIGLSLLPQATDVVDQLCQSRNEVRPIVIMRNSAFVACSIAKVVAITAHAPLIVFAVIVTAEFALVGIALYAYSRLPALAFAWSDASIIEGRRLLREAWPLLLRLLAIGVYMRVDQVILGRLLDDHAVGIYAAATRISEIWYFIPLAMMTAFVPRLAEQHSRAPAAYEADLHKVMRAIVALSALAALTMSLGARLIIATLYGPAYAAAAPILAVHAWSGLFVGLGVASSSWFVNNGMMRFGLYQAIAGAVISLGLNLFLVPRIGVIGAAWAAVGSYAVSAVLLNAVFKSTRPILRLQLAAIGFA